MSVRMSECWLWADEAGGRQACQGQGKATSARPGSQARCRGQSEAAPGSMPGVHTRALLTTALLLFPSSIPCEMLAKDRSERCCNGPIGRSGRMRVGAVRRKSSPTNGSQTKKRSPNERRGAHRVCPHEAQQCWDVESDESCINLCARESSRAHGRANSRKLEPRRRREHHSRESHTSLVVDQVAVLGA